MVTFGPTGLNPMEERAKPPHVWKYFMAALVDVLCQLGS